MHTFTLSRINYIIEKFVYKTLNTIYINVLLKKKR